MTFTNGQSWCPVMLLICNLQYHFIHLLRKTLLNISSRRGCREKFGDHTVEKNWGMSEGRLFTTGARRSTTFKAINSKTYAAHYRYIKSDTSCPTDVVQHEKKPNIVEDMTPSGRE
ncbi:hypothetical protein AVEN_58755-1 [Araneus ventricosus]|uniref:Uncharacterized protein n=1 Tax=Araneus ventricosus TaxID=182803 RepID=A0A4Y2G3S1_ARAVE|nr:hypothetical protein AVEN_58755-1 [Araneus ventricosus]